MHVYDKRHRLQKHYAGGGIFDFITNVISEIAGNAPVKKAATEIGKTIVTKVGNTAGEKIVNAIRKKKNLNAKSQAVLKMLSQLLDDVKRQNVLKALTQPSISNILEGSGQAIAVEELTKRLNR